MHCAAFARWSCWGDWAACCQQPQQRAYSVLCWCPRLVRWQQHTLSMLCCAVLCSSSCFFLYPYILPTLFTCILLPPPPLLPFHLPHPPPSSSSPPHHLPSLHPSPPWAPTGMPRPGGLASLFEGGADGVLREPAREEAVLRCGLPYVVVKAGSIKDVPGGANAVRLLTPARPATSDGGAGGAAAGGGAAASECTVSREDLASAVVAAAAYLPSLDSPRSASSTGGSSGAVPVAGVAFEVADAGPGAPPESWEALVNALTPRTGAAV